jgi:hypothetical protein
MLKVSLRISQNMKTKQRKQKIIADSKCYIIHKHYLLIFRIELISNLMTKKIVSNKKRESAYLRFLIVLKITFLKNIKK